MMDPNADRLPAAQDTGDSRWRGARCLGSPELFFAPAGPEHDEARLERESAALSLCMQCPIRACCLEYALKHHIRFGIWGGRTERDRAQPGGRPPELSHRTDDPA